MLYLLTLQDFFAKALKTCTSNPCRASAGLMSRLKDTGDRLYTAFVSRIGGNKEEARVIDFNKFNV
jgi:hypothetical protein